MNAVTSPRNPSSGPSYPVSDFPVSDRALGWWGVLPPIRLGTRCAWLPLSDTAMVAIIAAISASPSTRDENTPGELAAEHPSDPLVVRQIVKAMGDDPPLLLFVLFQFRDAGFVSVTELAEWVVDQAPRLFADGEWILSIPSIHKVHQHRWSRLMAQSRSAPPQQWVTTAREWLCVLGDEIGSDEIAGLPEVIWDCDDSEPQSARGSVLLQQLARARSRQDAMESSLSALAETKKLGAAKQLAYGLSHEINNPLANISARAQQLAHDEKDPNRVRSLDQIVQQVYRAHEMISGLMFFANPPEVNQEKVDLNELVLETAEEYRTSANDVDIRLLVNVLPQPTETLLDRAMFLEAIRALVRNSIEAIGTGGTIVISMDRSRDADGSEICQIHVTDSGPGLGEESSKHAFDPFYSGREAGRGLGLGLCRAYRVAQLHGATIRISGGLAGCVATITLSMDADSAVESG